MSIAKRSSVVALVMSCALTSFAAGAESDRTAGRVMDDAAITTKVKAELIGNPDTKAYQINVDTLNGVVSLSGFVDSNSQKQAAETEAKAVAGVKSVENRLMVKTSGAGNPAYSSTSGAKRTVDDSALTAKVKSKLISDSLTKARDINVETNNGIVQLNGFVSSSAEKEQAAQLASSVEGVLDVQNQLQVKAGAGAATR